MFLKSCSAQKHLGLTLSLDTNWDPQEKWDGQIQTALAYADLFFPNANEAILISGCEELEPAIDWLVKRVPVVAVKLGASGALVASGQEQGACAGRSGAKPG